MIGFRSIRALRSNQEAAAAIEFGILAPALFVMVFGIMQVGIGMQSYNALRSASADVARYAVVQRQKNVQVTASGLQTYSRTVAVAAPYMLDTADLSSTVTLPTTRISGVTEYQLVYTYTVPNVLTIIDLPDISITYTRPIFVI
jgi:Flp pilus assembly protein TadG